jgi:coenzyme PQQ precursor peptide PqqA
MVDSVRRFDVLESKRGFPCSEGSQARRTTLKSLVRMVSMEWTTPAFEEIQLCCEINSYVSAQL